MVGPGEIARRARGRVTGRIESLPILALSVHSACNCRCVMCDIWKANADKREISADDLSRHVDAIRRLRVQRVMLTGGEPLLHRNLWALCALLRAVPVHRSFRGGRGIRLTLVTTGLLVDNHAADIAASIDTVVISLDGPREVHDAIRRVKGGFDRIAKGVMALRAQHPAPRLIARCVVQRDNAAALAETIESAHRMGFDEISFLAADVSSAAFNRPEPWPETRVSQIAVPSGELAALAASIDRAVAVNPERFENGFVAGGRASLDRILQYYRALAGVGQFPEVHCNAPWISAVLEPHGNLRPCFFQPAYGSAAGLEDALNAPAAIAFRQSLDVTRDDTCRRCVCSLQLPLGRKV
jgi:MoaA/NifB/PqqE/SkfB family radical SAM enzyme